MFHERIFVFTPRQDVTGRSYTYGERITVCRIPVTSSRLLDQGGPRLTTLKDLSSVVRTGGSSYYLMRGLKGFTILTSSILHFVQLRSGTKLTHVYMYVHMYTQIHTKL